jgi:hypothetical protein
MEILTTPNDMALFTHRYCTCLSTPLEILTLNKIMVKCTDNACQNNITAGNRLILPHQYERSSPQKITIRINRNTNTSQIRSQNKNACAELKTKG